MHTKVHSVRTGSRGVKEESNGRRSHLLGKEYNQGKLQGLRGDKGSVITSSPYGEVT